MWRNRSSGGVNAVRKITTANYCNSHTNNRLLQSRITSLVNDGYGSKMERCQYLLRRTYRHVARHEGREVALRKHGNGCDPRRSQCSGDGNMAVIGGATEFDQAGPLT